MGNTVKLHVQYRLIKYSRVATEQYCGMNNIFLQ